MSLSFAAVLSLLNTVSSYKQHTQHQKNLSAICGSPRWQEKLQITHNCADRFSTNISFALFSFFFPIAIENAGYYYWTLAVDETSMIRIMSQESGHSDNAAT